jgi:DNA adenine methylase
MADSVIGCNRRNGGSGHIRPAFGYFGSKSRLAFQLCKELPPHNAWVEVFCGSAALTLGKTPAPLEVINDLDHEIVNFFQQLRDHHKKLCRLVALTPYSREELTQARTRTNAISKIERARRFLVSSMMAINGAFGDDEGGFSYSDSYCREGLEARVCRWYNLPDRVSKAAERLRGVRIENKDGLELFGQFINRPATLVYLDPPYLGKRCKGYIFDAKTEEFHKKLLRLANRAKCMVFISGYSNELYNQLLSRKKGWRSRTIETTTRDSSGRTHLRTEVIWMNKHFCKAKAEAKVPIRLFAKEIDDNKINPLRPRKNEKNKPSLKSRSENGARVRSKQFPMKFKQTAN